VTTTLRGDLWQALQIECIKRKCDANDILEDLIADHQQTMACVRKWRGAWVVDWRDPSGKRFIETVDGNLCGRPRTSV
jgi:hypothetical protein